jgi:diguanylate cyclase (GGDEF)-like protein
MTKHLKLKLRLSSVDRSLLVMVPIVMIAVFFILLAMLSLYQKTTIETTMRVAHTLSTNQRNQLDSFIENRIQMLSILAEQPEIYRMDKQEQKDFIKRWSRESGFSHIFIVNMDGIGWYPTEGSGVVRDQSESPFVKDISNQEVFVTAPFLKDDGPITTVCVAIHRPDGVRVGTLCGAFYLNMIQSVIDDDTVIYGGSCYILDKQNRHITFEGDKAWNYQSFEEEGPAEISLLSEVRESGKGQEGRVVLNGKEQYASVQKLDNAPWLVMVSVPKENVESAVGWVERMFAVLSLLAFLLVFSILHILKSWRKSDAILYADQLCPCASRVAMQQMIHQLDPVRDQSIAILYADLNRFKYVNDHFGHEAGDQLLITFARVLSDVFSPFGLTTRVGGDEFVVILPDVSLAVISDCWEQVEQALALESRQLPFPYEISSSYGIAMRDRGSDVPLNVIVNHADQRMYAYKDAFKKKHQGAENR